MKTKLLGFSIAIAGLCVVGCWITYHLSHPGESTYRGKTLGQWLGVDATAGTNILTLKRVFTGAEPDVATFSVPVSYCTVTNLGKLDLWVDGRCAEFEECRPTANGDCLLSWWTTYSNPGQHHLQARLYIANGLVRKQDAFGLLGPAVPFYSSNVCQFEGAYNDYDSTGTYLHAKLRAPVASYSIDLQTSNGFIVKTIVGRTSNGVIDARWDLVAADGQKYRGTSIDAVFHVNLSNSIQGTHTQRLCKEP